MKVYSWDDTLTFGKHKNRTLRQVLGLFPNYIQWAVINIEWFMVCEEIVEIIQNNKRFNVNQKKKEIFHFVNRVRQIEIIDIIVDQTYVSLEPVPDQDILKFEKPMISKSFSYSAVFFKFLEIKIELHSQIKRDLENELRELSECDEYSYVYDWSLNYEDNSDDISDEEELYLAALEGDYDNEWNFD